MPETIAISADHGGFHLKQTLLAQLTALGYAAQDMGSYDEQSVDYPDFAKKLCHWVLEAPNRRGVLVCGSGIGMSIAANRHNGIRAALVHSGLEAELSRRHNNANVLCLGARIIGEETAKEALSRFLATPFEGGRHAARVEKLG